MVCGAFPPEHLAVTSMHRRWTTARPTPARAGRRELLVVLAIKVVNGVGLAAVLLLGKGVLDGVITAGRSGAGAGMVLPRLLLLTVVMAGLGSPIGSRASARPTASTSWTAAGWSSRAATTS
jgi:hypothetical protein